MKVYTVEMEIKIVAEDEQEATAQSLYYVKENYPITCVTVTCTPWSEDD